MSNVSYQSILGGAGRPRDVYVRLGPESVGTRRRDAKATLKVGISKQQDKWLRRVEDVTGSGIDRDAVVRALLDVGRELDVDWALLSGADALRDAVRDAVMVRRRAEATAAGGAGAGG